MTSKLEKYYSTIPSIYSPQVNNLINGLVQAWAEQDETIVDQLEETKKQLFVETAEGEFLNWLGNSVGVPRPLFVALQDVFYRQLIEKMSFAPKQIRKTFYEVLDVFWGETYSRSNISSNNLETFNFGTAAGLTGTLQFENNNAIVNGVGTLFTSQIAVDDFIKITSHSNTTFCQVSRIVNDTKLYLKDGYTGATLNGSGVKLTPKTLSFKVDESDVITIKLSPKFFINTAAVTSQEVSNAINNENTDIFAIPIRTILSGSIKNVNLRTQTPGLNGSIEVTGGTVNALLDFPLGKNTIYDLDKSTVIYEINPRELIIQIPNLVAKLIRTLKGAWHIHDDIEGTILSFDNIAKTAIVDLSESVTTNQLVGLVVAQGLNIFTIIANTSGQNGVVLTFSSGDDISILEDDGSQNLTFGNAINWAIQHNLNQQRPNITLYDNFDQIIGADIFGNDANLATTTFSIAQSGRAVVGTQNHVFNQVAPATTWTINHNLNQQYLKVDVYDSSNNLITPDTIVATNANTMTLTFLPAQSGYVSLMIGNVFTQAVASTLWSINHNLLAKHVQVTVYDASDAVIGFDIGLAVDKNNFSVSFVSPQAGKIVIVDTGYEGEASFRLINRNYPNSYTYDTDAKYSITGTRTFITQSIAVGEKILNLIVDDASDFPNGDGFLVLNFGRSNEEGPIAFKARPDNQLLVLSPLYTFKNVHANGDIVNYVSSITPYIPRKFGEDYPTYITGTQEALDVVQALLSKIKAVGVVIRWAIDEPIYNFCCDC